MRLILFILSCISYSAFAASVDIKVTLSPTGSFVAHSDAVTGFAVKEGAKIKATNVQVNMKSFKTGIALRDKHFQNKLEAEKFPIAIASAVGSNNAGSGQIKIKGIEKSVNGTYKLDGNKLVVTFTLKPSEFGINDVSYMGVGVEDDVEVVVNIPVQGK